jgi:hypothetical protein
MREMGKCITADLSHCEISRDGFVRFVRLDQQFEIAIFGEGVEQHGQNVYRLTNLDPALGQGDPWSRRPAEEYPWL